MTSCCLYSAHKLCQITWNSGLLAQLEQHVIVEICYLSHTQAFGRNTLSKLHTGSFFLKSTGFDIGDHVAIALMPWKHLSS